MLSMRSRWSSSSTRCSMQPARQSTCRRSWLAVGRSTNLTDLVRLAGSPCITWWIACRSWIESPSDTACSTRSPRFSSTAARTSSWKACTFQSHGESGNAGSNVERADTTRTPAASRAGSTRGMNFCALNSTHPVSALVTMTRRPHSAARHMSCNTLSSSNSSCATMERGTDGESSRSPCDASHDDASSVSSQSMMMMVSLARARTASGIGWVSMEADGRATFRASLSSLARPYATTRPPAPPDPRMAPLAIVPALYPVPLALRPAATA
mmetsp:Transcript_121960/g.296016  ORF Transcript_121960/g.296016 Transcript_121960/m.296016 type:complete len:269 (-) Transcript_121960:328-1134(-)